ncbi:unnamed protein product [Phytophthora fragariaefolia]|uniref:Unnamed protein product n=1 Tax=Phytophthora fragariaefolia TaxID=1490495 RepID=A0A9W6YNZ5_9STRA|nr:unnamed protein product [Phytophthora fragariaefolia]
MQMSAEELSLEPAIYIHEGSELLAQLRDELAMLPELQELSPECDISKADVGEPGRTTPAEEEKPRTRLRYHHRIFLGDGNAAPAPARGMWCDLDVGDAKPVAQRPRSIAPHLAIKVYELLKKLLETGLIEHSGSPWASPIVIVLKKNGVDIRMCIDYRVVNGFIQLSNYPLPLIDDLLIDFERAMWFKSLDMASGFWAIRMTERVKPSGRSRVVINTCSGTRQEAASAQCGDARRHLPRNRLEFWRSRQDVDQTRKLWMYSMATPWLEGTRGSRFHSGRCVGE